MSICVLVVEDHADLRMAIKHLLINAGYETICAATVEEALAVLKRVPRPCIVLWDPVTLQMSLPLIVQTAQNGIPLATIPVSVSSVGQDADGYPMFRKKLTSSNAVLSVVREHCPDPQQMTG